jgi:putative MFS transporter
MAVTPLTSYQRRLLVFLSVATFFEGYDFLALMQVLPALRKSFGIDHAAAGVLFTVVNAGTIIAYLLIRKADRLGRKRVLGITIAGYATFTGLSGFAPNIYVFGLLQLAARVFLVAEYATAMVVAAEEFPADRRGMALGLIQTFTSFGGILCAGLVPLLVKTEYGWRSVYFIGVIPLIILAYARRSLRETQRFTATADRVGAGSGPSFFAILQGPYRKRVLQLGAIWFLSYLTMQNAISFWKDYALTERGLSEAQAGGYIAAAAAVSLPMLAATGKLLDWIGRRHGAGVIFGLGSLGVFGCYSLPPGLLLGVSLTFAIWATSAFLPVLTAFNTELFPTELRANAMAWSNNLIGRLGYVFSPLLIGSIAEQMGWGTALRPTVVFALGALICVYLWMPETAGRELEDTARPAE